MTVNDHQVRVVGKDIDLRGVSVSTRELCEEARRMHGTSPVATVALAQALTGSLLMSAVTVKGPNKVGLQLRGDGPLREVYADADGLGRVRGYVGHALLEEEAGASDSPGREGLNVKEVLGTGFLSVTTDLDMADRYHGIVSLLPSDMAGNIMHYFHTSVQIPTYASIAVDLHEDGSVAAAGGFLVQNIPGKHDSSLAEVEGNILGLPPLLRLLREEGGTARIMEGVFHGYRHEVLGREEISYTCPCSRERVERTLIALGQDELEDMLVQDMGAEIKCEFCARQYTLNADDLLELLRRLSENT